MSTFHELLNDRLITQNDHTSKETLPIFIAPMVGLSHVATREWLRCFIPKNYRVLMFSEMLSSRRIPNQNIDHIEKLSVSNSEKEEYSWIPQLLINEERFIEPSIQRLAAYQPWGFDINMGCPVKHTLKHNWGFRLMGDPQYAKQIVSWARDCYDGPLSVKLRLIENESETIPYMVNFIKEITDAGANWITLHGRFQTQHHKGAPRWDILESVTKKIDIPMVVNGGIQSSEDMHQLLQVKKFAGIMIARAALVKPWLVWQYIHEHIEKKPPMEIDGFELPQTPKDEGSFYIKSLQVYCKKLDEYYKCETYKLERLLFLITYGVKWFDFGHSFWKGFLKKKTWIHAKEWLNYYHENHQLTMSQSYSLRN